MIRHNSPWSATVPCAALRAAKAELKRLHDDSTVVHHATSNSASVERIVVFQRYGEIGGHDHDIQSRA